MCPICVFDATRRSLQMLATQVGIAQHHLVTGPATQLLQLGNGEKLIFDMGTGSMERIYALGIPLDFIDRVFLTYLHMDHMGDLPGYYIYGPQNNRSKPLRISISEGWYKQYSCSKSFERIWPQGIY